MDYWVAIVLSVIGIISGVSGVVLSIENRNLARVETMARYYEEADSSEFKSQRIEFLKGSDVPITFKNPKPYIGKLLGFYDKWALMCLNGYLPLSVFEGNPRYTLLLFYSYVDEYIQYRRAHPEGAIQNTGYAIAVERLAKKVYHRYYA